MKKRTKRLSITLNAPVVLTIGAISFVATLLNYLTGGKTGQMLFMTYRSSLANPLTYLRLFTHVLGHASWEHLVGNLAYILLLGPLLEEKYGSRKLLAVIAITAAITGVLNALLFPNIALCGASGVVFAFILLSSVAHVASVTNVTTSVGGVDAEEDNDEGNARYRARIRLAQQAVSTCGTRAAYEYCARQAVAAIADAVKGDITILVDGGIRSGVDIFRALALGADGVLIGRPVVPYIYAAGREGLYAYLDKLIGELTSTMTMCGAASLKDIDGSKIWNPPCSIS